MKPVLVVTMLIAVGCSSSHKKGALPPGPNYSTTPCSENCGADPTCNASCTPVAQPGQPQPIMIGK